MKEVKIKRKDLLRISSYLNVADVGGGSSLLFNGFTSRIDLVPSDVASELIGTKGWRDFSFFSPDEVQYLANRGHLTGLSTAGEQEEFRKLAEHILGMNEATNSRKNGKRAIAFILTYKCNLSCSYCYQAGLRKNENIPSMDEAFVDEFFRLYLNKLFPRCHKKNMGFLLFGGEPLLPGNRGAIERILHYAGKYGIVVSASTNAVMLPKMLDLIGPENGKINNVQVTLDGGRGFHDEIRIPQSGAPTFDDIIDSIRELIRVKAQAIIRMHLHPEKIESARGLAEYLEREGILGHDRAYVYFSPINSFDGRGVSQSYVERFSELFQHISFAQHSPPSTFARGFARIMDANGMKSRLKTRFCSAGAGVLRVVDALGDVYDCYEEAGNKDRRTATLGGGKVKYFKLKDKYERRHILNMPECLKCSVALYCGGGCMSQARLQRGSILKSFCLQNKEIIGQTLKAYYLLNRAGKAGSVTGDIP